MAEYDLEFLKSKGFFEKAKIEIEDRIGKGKELRYVFDSQNRLAYFDDFEDDEISEIVKNLKKKRNFDYYWFWKKNKVYCFRTYGENKRFVFNVDYSKRSRKSEYSKSKSKKLRDFSLKNPTVLFDVKDVVEHFYRRLWEIRIKLARCIVNDLPDKVRILTAQRIIDRLIFTYFLGEKGVIKGKDNKGKILFLSPRDFFEYLARESTNFYGTINTIFFEFLNSTHDDMKIPGREGFSLLIPYLNGEVFRENILKTKKGKDIKESDLEIVDFDWMELIGELNQYNWIIERFTPTEAEDTIGDLTPEILGHIYEKFVITISKAPLDSIDIEKIKTTQKGELQSGRKKIGGYYTPEAITDYISRKTIWPYIRKKLSINRKYKSFEEFYDSAKSDGKLLERTNSELKLIRVLDAAVGSGHFLMSAAELIRNWRRSCGEQEGEYDLRKEIVINNLFGVDIMEGAIEICKLRFWLWIVGGSDPNEDIDPLPNIDFNFRVGNSLIGFVETPIEKMLSDELSLRPLQRDMQRRLAGKTKIQTVMEPGKSIETIMKERGKLIKRYKTTQKNAEIIKKKIEKGSVHLRQELDKKLLSKIKDCYAGLSLKELQEHKPFHWGFEFFDVFNGVKAKNEVGFDIIIGNPPYGNLLNTKEKKIIFSYQTKNLGEIAANFIERQLELLRNGGILGNITILKVAYASRFMPLRRLLRENLEKTKIACFERRPSQIFKDAQIQVGILVGSQTDSKYDGSIQTSKFIRLNEEEISNLNDRLQKIEFYDTEDFVLGDRIGGTCNKYEILPKIGNEMSASILRKLKLFSNRIVDDCTNENGKYVIYRIRGAGYHPTCMLEELYKSNTVQPIGFDNKLERDFTFLAVNSQLFYLYWMIYSNARHLNTGLIKRFPIPPLERIKKQRRRIYETTNCFWDRMKKVFDPDKHYIYVTSLKSLNYDIVDLLADLYELNANQVTYIKKYDSKYIW